MEANFYNSRTITNTNDDEEEFNEDHAREDQEFRSRVIELVDDRDPVEADIKTEIVELEKKKEIISKTDRKKTENDDDEVEEISDGEDDYLDLKQKIIDEK